MLDSKNCPFVAEKRAGLKCTKLAIAAAMGLFAISQSGAYADVTAPADPPAGTIDSVWSDIQGNYANGTGDQQGQVLNQGDNIANTALVDTNGVVDMGSSYHWVSCSAGDVGAYYIPTYDEETGELVDGYYKLVFDVNTNDFDSRLSTTSDHDDHNLFGHYINTDYSGNNTGNKVGGGIYNDPSTSGSADLYDIVGDFIQDQCVVADGTNNFSHGGGIDNHGTIRNVYGDFIGNYVYTPAEGGNNVATDGAGLRNGKTIETVTGNFIGNYVNGGNGINAYGGGIANHRGANDTTATTTYIGSIDGNFISNKAKTGGGAVYNYSATIGEKIVLVYDEDNNPVYVQEVDGDGKPVFDVDGNPVYVQARDGNGNLIFDADNNPVYVQATEDIGHFNGYFVNNESVEGAGGAVYNSHNGIIKNMNGTFIANKAKTDGGAFYNTVNAQATIDKGDFFINTAENDGGAFYNTESAVATIKEGNFVRNTAGHDGGAIYTNNNSTATVTKGDFIGNKAGNDGGAIYTNNESTATVTSGNFVQNSAGANGGAIYTNEGSTATVTGNFVENSAGANGGAIFANGHSLITASGTFVNNKAVQDGGAVYNTNGAIANLTGDFVGNSAQRGGAIYNDSDFVVDPLNPDVTGVNMTVSGNFINNKATGHGGAIYSKSDINLDATGKTYTIDGNTANGKDEAIYMEGRAADPILLDEEFKPNLNLITNNGGRWIINDNINGTAGLYNVNMNGGGTVSLYRDINGGNVFLNDGTTLDTVNNETHTYTVNEFTVTGDGDRSNASSMKVDVDIQKQEMDRIATASETDNQGNTGWLNVDGFHFINDSKTGKATILFAEDELAERVLNNGKAYDEDNNQHIVTPARIYDIGYSIHNDNRGYFEFSNQWNPAILAAPVVLQAGVQSAMNTTMLYAFNHLDTYTKIPKFDRLTMMNHQNRYALSTDFNDNNSPLRQYNLRENRTTNEGVWLRPYAMFESIPLKNGPKVDSITYGSFLGFDSDFREHRNGWHSVWSTYLGYQGGQLDFRGVSANLNGGVLGITDTFYKGNFWTALTLTGGAMNADISTMYGHEDSVSIYGGIASKTGYNFEFKDGKYILQPIVLASYTFANMLDYKNAAGVKVDANTMHTIHFNPSLRFITNLKNGWQPYARVGMVWNFLNETDMNAYGYHLPDMHIKPYVEYGLGVQKIYNHRFTGFAQAMMRNGGRNGVALTLGFRYALGREGNDEEFSKLSPWEKFKAFFK